MTTISSQSSTSDYFIAPGGKEPVDLAGHKLTMLATSENTHGKLCIFEARNLPSFVADRHIHHDAVKTFYVVEGTYRISVGDETFDAPPGSFVLVPRHAPHHFETGPEGGRVVFTFVPAGMENFFIEEARLLAEGRHDEETVAELYRRYDVEPAPLPT